MSDAIEGADCVLEPYNYGVSLAYKEFVDPENNTGISTQRARFTPYISSKLLETAVLCWFHRRPCSCTTGLPTGVSPRTIGADAGF